MKTFGAHIKELRKQAGLSQDQLAGGCVSKGMISQIEGGRVYPSDDLLRRLAVDLQVSWEWLCSLREADQQYRSRFKEAKQLMDQEQWEQALILLRECEADPHPNWPTFDLQMAISRCLGHVGDHQQARVIVEGLLRLALKYQEQGVKDVVRAYDALGYLAYTCEGRPGIAIEEWERALQELEQYPRKREVAQQAVKVCQQLADVHHHLGQYQQTLTYYKHANRWVKYLAKGHGQKALVQVGMARTLMRMGDYKKADIQLKEAAEYYESSEESEGLLAVSVQQVVLMRKQDQLAEIADLLPRCLERAEQFGDLNLLGILRLEQAYWQREAGNWQVAVSEATCAHDLLLETGQEAELLDVYRLLMQLYKEQEAYKEASFWGGKLQERLQSRLDQHGYGVPVEKKRRKKSSRK